MKKIFNLYNITLVILLTLISVLTLRTTEVKATGTVTWPSGSTATISRTVQNVYNAPKVDYTYSVEKKTATGKTADFDTGENVNAKMKNLANNSSSMNSSSDDTLIQAIKRGNTLPSGFTPTTANTISTSTSEYPIYIWWDSSTSTIYYYSEADIVYLNADSQAMFQYFESLVNIDGLADWDTSRVIYMAMMFVECKSLANINVLSSWDTSSVELMDDLFNGCTSLVNISALSNWDITSVTDMPYMFEECTSLTNINALSNWDTSSVTNMWGMFTGCSSLSNINGASNWDTSNVEWIAEMFLNCPKASGTIQILSNPEEYDYAFDGAATASGAQITVNYGANTPIDAIIATKSSSSNVVKGVQVSAPTPSPSGGVIATATISFNGTETVSNTYTVNKSTTINLANMGVSFTEPGNYEYTVSESATSNNAYPTTNTEYTIVINVRNELNANNRPTGNLEATFVIKDSNDNKVNTMSFSSPKDESKFGHIELTKKVKGLMGSITKYFEFSVQIDDAASNACSSYSGNEKYPISGVDSGQYSAAEVTKCKSGTKDSLSLKHNQTAIIGQFTYNNNTYDSISIGDYYKIIESAESDYTTTFKINSGSTTSGRDTGSKTITHSGNKIGRAHV